jgi:hypothetical protein
MIRILLRIVAVLVLLYAAAVAGLAVAMRQPPDTFGRIMAKMPPVAFMALPFQPLWMNARAGALEAGQPAPDFALKTVDGGSTVRLSSFRGQRPAVLIFGSYT